LACEPSNLTSKPSLKIGSGKNKKKQKKTGTQASCHPATWFSAEEELFHCRDLGGETFFF
jgi:hypothetical protein